MGKNRDVIFRFPVTCITWYREETWTTLGELQSLLLIGWIRLIRKKFNSKQNDNISGDIRNRTKLCLSEQFFCVWYVHAGGWNVLFWLHSELRNRAGGRRSYGLVTGLSGRSRYFSGCL